MCKIISEEEFHKILIRHLTQIEGIRFSYVTGPGRSGAVAAAYTSHYLGIPFIPYGVKVPVKGNMLVVDTAAKSGKTIKKAMEKYSHHNPLGIVFFNEPPRVKFWYEKASTKKLG